MGGQSSGYQSQGGYGQQSYGGYGGGYGQQYGGMGGGYGNGGYQPGMNQPQFNNNFSNSFMGWGSPNYMQAWGMPQWGGWGQQWQQPGGGQIGGSPANQAATSNETAGGMMAGGNMGPQRGISDMRRPGYQSPGYVPPGGAPGGNMGTPIGIGADTPYQPPLGAMSGGNMANPWMDYLMTPNQSAQMG